MLDPYGLACGDTFGDCWFEQEFEGFVNEIPNYVKKCITESAEASRDCVYCTAKCTIEVVLPSAAQSHMIKKVLYETAKGLAKKALGEAIPYYNVVDNIVIRNRFSKRFLC